MRRYLVLIIIILALALTHLYIFTSSIGLKYNVAKLKIEHQKLYSENRRLNYLIARGESLPKIDEIASSKLSMVYPEKINYIVIGSKEAD